MKKKSLFNAIQTLDCEQIEILSRHFQLIVVDNSIGRIENTEVIKDGRSFKNVKKYINYKLTPNNNEHTLFFNVIQSFKSLENFEQVETQNIKYLKLNFLEKIFLRNRKKRLMNKIQEMSKGVSWIIIPNLVSEQFLKLQDFISNTSNDKIFFGTYNNISIFINPNIISNEIYFGDYNSFKIIINSDNLDFSSIDKSKLKVLHLI